MPWTTVALAGFHWAGSLPPAQFTSSPGVTRSFCPHCGTPLAYFNDSSPTTLDLTLGSLDDAEQVAPADHTWMDDALRWDRPADGLPAHRRARRG